jgi:hypothetical protein
LQNSYLEVLEATIDNLEDRLNAREAELVSHRISMVKALGVYTKGENFTDSKVMITIILELFRDTSIWELVYHGNNLPAVSSTFYDLGVQEITNVDGTISYYVYLGDLFHLDRVTCQRWGFGAAFNRLVEELSNV